jgi:carbamoyl-phosphate synthase large subunit
MARALNVVGLMNVQFAIKDGVIYVLEVNPRASRTVPFVAKATDSAIASIAARLMAGEPLSTFPARAPYPAGRRPRQPAALADPLTLADPQTPVVQRERGRAALRPLPRRRSAAGAGNALDGRGDGLGPHLRAGLPQGADGRRHDPAGSGRAFLSVKDMDKTAALPPPRATLWPWASRSSPPGHRAMAGRPRRPAEPVAKVYEGRPNIVDRLKNDEIALVMNTTEGTQAVSDSRDIRRVALMDKIPYFTTAAAAIAVVSAMKARGEGYGVRTLQG